MQCSTSVRADPLVCHRNSRRSKPAPILALHAAIRQVSIQSRLLPKTLKIAASVIRVAACTSVRITGVRLTEIYNIISAVLMSCLGHKLSLQLLGNRSILKDQVIVHSTGNNPPISTRGALHTRSVKLNKGAEPLLRPD